MAEDDDDVREALAVGLRKDGHEVVEVPNGDGVKAYIEECVIADATCPRVASLVTDLRMPGMNGLSLLSYIQQLGWDLPTVVVTAFGDEETRELAEKFGAPCHSRQAGRVRRVAKSRALGTRRNMGRTGVGTESRNQCSCDGDCAVRTVEFASSLQLQARDSLDHARLFRRSERSVIACASRISDLVDEVERPLLGLLEDSPRYSPINPSTAICAPPRHTTAIKIAWLPETARSVNSSR